MSTDGNTEETSSVTVSGIPGSPLQPHGSRPCGITLTAAGCLYINLICCIVLRRGVIKPGTQCWGESCSVRKGRRGKKRGKGKQRGWGANAPPCQFARRRNSKHVQLTHNVPNYCVAGYRSLAHARHIPLLSSSVTLTTTLPLPSPPATPAGGCNT